MAKRKRVRVFKELKVSLETALAYEQGKPVALRATEIPPAPRRMTPAQIREIRASLNASQALFARFLNVSTNTIRSWEQGTRRPETSALKLLVIARRHPAVLLET